MSLHAAPVSTGGGWLIVHDPFPHLGPQNHNVWPTGPLSLYDTKPHEKVLATDWVWNVRVVTPPRTCWHLWLPEASLCCPLIWDLSKQNQGTRSTAASCTFSELSFKWCLWSSFPKLFSYNPQELWGTKLVLNLHTSNFSFSFGWIRGRLCPGSPHYPAQSLYFSNCSGRFGEVVWQAHC